MKLRAITACAALAMAGAGCGSEADEGEREATAPATTATATATAAAGGDTMPAEEWSREVEELCDANASKAERESVELMQKVMREGGTEAEAVAQVLEHSAKTSKPFLDKIAALPAPRGMEAQAKEFDRRMRDIVPNLQALADMSREDVSQKELEATTDRFLKEVLPVRALARDLNIHACIPRNSQP